MPISAKQLNEILQLISDASASLAVTAFGYEITPEHLQRLVADGWITAEEAAVVQTALPVHKIIADGAKGKITRPPVATEKTVIGTAFELGRLKALNPDDIDTMGFDTFKEKLKTQSAPLTPTEQIAKQHAITRAGEMCVGLGNRYAGEIVTIKVKAETDLERAIREFAESDEAKEVITAEPVEVVTAEPEKPPTPKVEPVATASKETEAKFQEIIKEKVSEAIEEHKAVNQLTTDLRQATEDWARDWQRIAATEMQLAYETGFVESTKVAHGSEARMAKIPEPSACGECLKHYLGPDGKPRIMPVSWWEKNGVSNFGRKKAEWKAVTGAMHPWCRCTLVRVPEMMHFNDDWSLIPDGMELKKSRKLHGRMTFLDMEISIENRRGSIRRWYDPFKKHHGETKMKYPYGYIRLTEGTDGDHIDCFVGPNEKATFAYVIHQMKAPDFKEFDEDKVMLGFDSRKEAKEAFLGHYTDERFFGSMDALDARQFAANVKAGRYRDGKKLVKADVSIEHGAHGIGHPSQKPVGTGGHAVGSLKVLRELLEGRKVKVNQDYADAAREIVQTRNDKLTRAVRADHAREKLESLQALLDSMLYIPRIDDAHRREQPRANLSQTDERRYNLDRKMEQVIGERTQVPRWGE